ncbi:plastocyanin [Hymenobacter sp. UYAg731]
MLDFYRLPRWALHTGLLLAPLGAAQAQAPVITSVIPMANARAAARNSPVTVNFNQPLTAASVGAMKVFSSQRGGLRTRGATPAVVSGSALSFTPTNYDFRPGETVQYTVTTAAAGSGGVLAQGRVGQFTAATAGGAGAGNFLPALTVAVGNYPSSMAVGDIDGDGDLDLLAANSNDNRVSIHLNNRGTSFGSGPDVSVGNNPVSLTVGDVDGDGDLDLLVANGTVLGSVSVRMNDGNGNFSNGQAVSVGNNPRCVTLGDVDGDGDLDLLAANASGTTISVRLNNGNGTFNGSQEVGVGTSPVYVAVADVDNDGDLDLLVTNATSSGLVSVRLNDGSGLFSGSQSVSVDNVPRSIAVGDLDGDGDVDFITASNGSNTVSVRLNDGSGNFSGSQTVRGVGNQPFGVALGDVDGDGDLDFFSTTNSAGVSIRFNDGSSIFSGSNGVSVGNSPRIVIAADIDGDGDLDLLVSNVDSNTISISLNGGTGPLAAAAGYSAAALTLFPNPAHGTTTLTGATPNSPLAVLDALGRVRLKATADATGTARLALPEGLPAGVYLVRSGGQVRRLAVE